jgi:peptidoglycan/xylan/chitin deacetylase (PgdA/CDA1 family)
MVIGCHSHQHRSLATLTEEELRSDLTTSMQLVVKYLGSSHFLPFCYPYGKENSFTGDVVKLLKRLGFVCSFSTEVGQNYPGIELYALRRFDCKEVSAGPD